MSIEALDNLVLAARGADDDFTVDSHVDWDKSDAAPCADWAESWIRF
jgi:hypothetical protein